MATQNVEPSSETPLNLTLDQVGERVLQLVEKGHADTYQIGKLYNYVVDSNLALTGGFADAQAFFTQRVAVLSQAALSKYGAVARKYSEAASVKHGMSKLYTLLTYARRAKVEVDGNEPGLTPVAVPQSDGALTTKPFADCSMDEMRQAVTGQRAGGSPMPDDDAARIKSLQEQLDRHLPQKHGIRVEARRNAGELRVSLRNVPATQMARLVAVLVSPPPPDVAPVPQEAPMQVTPPQLQAVQLPVQAVAPQQFEAGSPPIQAVAPQQFEAGSPPIQAPQPRADAVTQRQVVVPPAQVLNQPPLAARRRGCSVCSSRRFSLCPGQGLEVANAEPHGSFALNQSFAPAGWRALFSVTWEGGPRLFSDRDGALDTRQLGEDGRALYSGAYGPLRLASALDDVRPHRTWLALVLPTRKGNSGLDRF